MIRPSPARLLVGATLAALLVALGASAALQLLGGGIRVRALNPAVAAPLLGVLGCLIVLHRPHLRLGPVLIANGVGIGLGTLAASALDYGAVHPIPHLAAQAAFATVSLTRIVVVAWVLFILWFPDDTFTSRGWRRFFVAATALCVGVSFAVWLAGPPDRVFDFYEGTRVPRGAGGPFAGTWTALGRGSDLLLVLPLVALGSLVQRYRREGAVVREQVRWLLVAMGVQVLGQIAGSALMSQGGAAHDLGFAVGIGTQPLPMLAATLAILRYRLWGIDLVVSRALVYGVLWAALSALLLVPPLAAGLLVGGRGALAAVGIALLVTAVFQPTRTRVERLAERLVYRHRTRPYALLGDLWETVRAADLDHVGPLLANAVHDGLGVAWAGVWLHVESPRGGSLRPLGVSGARSGPAVLAGPTTAAQLRASPGLVLAEAPPAELEPLWPGPPAAVVPLVAGDELVGVLACGPRRGDTLGASDFERLELLARECALRLRNLRLESQLRDRLVLIEQQADELRRSRQRLVTAQDEERRRIERDLHDGAQQQLVSLAARLRRLSLESDARSARLLADLASEAEESVFALQELGRGIFPSVLADQGLTAALRTQAARMPVAVRIDADDALAGGRLDRDHEAALYFVALEALTNAQKHAPGAAVLVRLGGDDGGVLLEIADDGPGFGAGDRAGTGLQNMADRVAAVGGALTVDSSPGAGTRIVAAVPVEGEAQALAADSRR